ncbi:MAG TPA: YoaK family protein [Mycobacterium sp.]|jgi:uncharacterized membrane protein YoaK (UPF0700 family)|nr:YoaK family protein [Mycobacterium sp.]
MNKSRVAQPFSATLPFALLLTLANSFLDAYTYLIRGGVFATAQTGNVVFLAVQMSGGRPWAALAHLWPIVAFIAGVALAAHMKSGRLDRHFTYPLRWAIALQVLVLLVIGFVPTSVPPSILTIPIAFVSALQIGLFRAIGDLAYVPIATTGNLLRFVESSYGGVADGSATSRRAAFVYAALIGTFCVGALVGAVFSRHLEERAIWLPAGLLGVTLLIYIADDVFRRRKQRALDVH